MSLPLCAGAVDFVYWGHKNNFSNSQLRKIYTAGQTKFATTRFVQRANCNELMDGKKKVFLVPSKQFSTFSYVPTCQLDAEKTQFIGFAWLQPFSICAKGPYRAKQLRNKKEKSYQVGLISATHLKFMENLSASYEKDHELKIYETTSDLLRAFDRKEIEMALWVDDAFGWPHKHKTHMFCSDLAKFEEFRFSDLDVGWILAGEGLSFSEINKFRNILNRYQKKSKKMFRRHSLKRPPESKLKQKKLFSRLLKYHQDEED